MIPRILLPFLIRVVKSVATTAVTPVLEKNVIATLGKGSPAVISMSRLIAMAFAVVVLREFWHSGLDGWPDATMGVATVLALPVMKAIQRAKPEDVLEVARLLLARLPSKFDDHRND